MPKSLTQLFKNALNSVDCANLGLYIHVPFCKQKCSYCDFFSVPCDSYKNILCPRSKIQGSLFTQKLVADILDISAHLQQADFSTIYIGGGTPSVLQPNDIFFLASAVSKQLMPDGEFTIELNPESVSPEFIRAAIAGGVNRFSLGVQTYNDAVLRSQHRLATSVDIQHALDILKKFSHTAKINLSADLIVGFEGQSEQTVASDLAQLIDAGIAHISVYTLCTADYVHDMYRDETQSLFDCAEKYLISHGFHRYEISNFALDGAECRHNKNYWQLGNYVGAGPSSVGNFYVKNMLGKSSGKDFADGFVALRTTGISDINRWLTESFPYTYETVTKQDYIKDYLLMGLRVDKGIDKKRFAAVFGCSPDTLIPRTIKKFTSFIEVNTEERLSLTSPGMDFLSAFLVEAFTELENCGSL